MVWLAGASVSPPQEEEAPPRNREPGHRRREPRPHRGDAQDAAQRKPVLCPKCQAQMQEGSMTGPDVELVEFVWVERFPPRQYGSLYDWLGDLLTGRMWGKVRRHPIGAFRCPSCGLVETRILEPPRAP